MSNRWDETWHRLLEWTNGQGPSERLAVQVLIHEGFQSVDPSHPLGGPDGGKDAVCLKNGLRWGMAVYFPRGQQDFATIRAKFDSDMVSVRRAGFDSIVFVTNQELRLAERRTLLELWPERTDLVHLERLTAVLDSPAMAGVRRQFLGIDPMGGGGEGGKGGSGGTIIGNRGTIIGGRGGAGGVSGRGGDGGGGGFILGDDGVIIGGDGGSAGTADGRGGRAARGVAERMGLPTSMWPYGRGGIGGNHPEYDRRLQVLKRIRTEYLEAFPEATPFVEAGVDLVPTNWVNKRLEELGETWRVELAHGGYVLPDLDGS